MVIKGHVMSGRIVRGLKIVSKVKELLSVDECVKMKVVNEIPRSKVMFVQKMLQKW
jgi:hypothetical protein